MEPISPFTASLLSHRGVIYALQNPFGARFADRHASSCRCLEQALRSINGGGVVCIDVPMAFFGGPVAQIGRISTPEKESEHEK